MPVVRRREELPRPLPIREMHDELPKFLGGPDGYGLMLSGVGLSLSGEHELIALGIGVGIYATIRAYAYFADRHRLDDYLRQVAGHERNPLDLPAYGQSPITCGNRCIAMVATKVLGRYLTEEDVYRAARVGLDESQVESVQRESMGKTPVQRAISETVKSVPVLKRGNLSPVENRIAMERLGLGYEETWDGDIDWLRERLSEGKNPIVSVDTFSLMPGIGRAFSLTQKRLGPHAIVVTGADDEYVYYNDSGPGIGIKRKATHANFMRAWKPRKNWVLGNKGRYAFCDNPP